MAVTATIFLGALGVFSGILPQTGDPSAPWYYRITSTGIFAVSVVFFLLTLGLAALKRPFPKSLKKAGYLLNHAGLWIIVAGMTFGAGDIQRQKIELKKGVAIAQPDVPFEITLLDFELHEYPAKLMLFDHYSGVFVHPGDFSTELQAGKTISLMQWKIAVETVYPSASKSNKDYISDPSGKGGQAAYIKVHGKDISGETKLAAEGWVAQSGPGAMPKGVVAGRYMLAVSRSQPKLFRSVIEYRIANGPKTKSYIEVNKPLAAEGWDLYQSSYDSSMGKHSDVSVLDAVRDPWLPVVYTGIFILLAGMLHMFVFGSRASIKKGAA